jgi:hypothetical protein
MNEFTKTIVFVVSAAVMALIAVSSHFLNQPTNSADFELVGQPFYEDFTSASQAESLEVVAVDPETGREQRFSVEKKDGLWRIPSHYDYPAEAADRLALTATSVMGIQRDSLAGRLNTEHERLGVVDPLSEDIDDPESVGKRITMKDGSDDVVVDYIIGKEVDQEVVLSPTERPYGNEGNEKYYYVRRPDEQQTYKVKLDIDLSTKFSDWIDPDLLRLNRTDLTRILIDNYTVEEKRSPIPGQLPQLFLAQGDQLDITRKSSTDPWELAGLKPETEELATGRINEIMDTLDQIKIVGVRPKFKYKDQLLLTADLKVNESPELVANQAEFAMAIRQMRTELNDKGYRLAGDAENLRLVSQQGELQLGTDKGLIYVLHIGQAIEGDEEAIEIGTSSNDEELEDQPSEDAASDESKTDSQSPDATDAAGSDGAKPDESSDDAKNRYLMVRVAFDESLITPKPEKPVEPVEPVAPEGYQPPAEEKSDDADEPAAPDDVAKPEDSEDDKAQEKDEKPPRNPEFVKYDEAMKQYEQQKIEFELAQTKFADQTKQYEEKIAEGQKLVDELNERFGDWYYVISAANLKTLQTLRKDLVTTKQPPAASPEVIPAKPDISFPGLPGLPNAETGEQPAAPNKTPEPAPKKSDETPPVATDKEMEAPKTSQKPEKAAQPSETTD